MESFNYNRGAYFITICTHNRKKLFSNIVGAIHESPEIRLNSNGRILEGYIKQLSKLFAIHTDKYVIMPDHIHLIIIIDDRAIPESPLHSRSLVSKAIGYLKMNVSRDIHKSGYGEKVWQRSYYDHIIRNQEDYNEIWEYIDNNPEKWLKAKQETAEE